MNSHTGSHAYTLTLTCSHSHTHTLTHTRTHMHTQPVVHACPLTRTPHSLTHSHTFTRTQRTVRRPALAPAPTRRQEAPPSTSAGTAGTRSAQLLTQQVHGVARPTPTIPTWEPERTLVPSLALLFMTHTRQNLIFLFQMLPETVFSSASQLKSKTGSAL